MVLIYIKNKRCLSLKQLKGYFTEDLTPESDIYADLLDYGRHGDIAEWLREKGETDMASKIDSIDTKLCDSAFYSQMKATISGSDVIESEVESLKPPFEKCFSFEGVKCVVNDNEAKVVISLKVLMCVNEEYGLSVSSNWGTCTKFINPYSYPEGKIACFKYTLRKCPFKDIVVLTVKAEKMVISQSFENSCEILVGDVKFKMIHVEVGDIKMGTDDEKYQVPLNSYSIGETPVTQELWQSVMGSNPAHFKGVQLPVESVSWNDCQDFIRKLNKKTGKQFRLPTETEWEFAARGGLESKGYEYSGCNDINVVAWYKGNSSNGTHPVKMKNPNELGIYDMSGNVWEWCQDCWGFYTSSSLTNPIGSISSLNRVYRGGSWGSGARGCHLSSRSYYSPGDASNGLGFRLALSE